MMLGYRSFFTVTNVSAARPLIDTALAQVHAWLRFKNYDADALQPGAPVEISENVSATLTTEIGEDGSESALFIMEEASPTGTWVTQLTLHDPHNRRREPWVWLDVHAPFDSTTQRTRPWTGRPRLATALLEVLEGQDNGIILGSAAQHVDAADVPRLFEALQSRDRRGLVFVAGSDETLPVEPWRELVSTLLTQTTGLAAGYVLDAEATAKFNSLAGTTHAIRPGQMRTFTRGVDFSSPLDAVRHRVLTTERIVGEPQGRFIQILGNRARDVTIEAALPRSVLRVEAALLRKADEDFFSAPRDAAAAIQMPDVAQLETFAAPPIADEAAAPSLEAAPFDVMAEFEVDVKTHVEVAVDEPHRVEIPENVRPALLSLVSEFSDPPVISSASINALTLEIAAGKRRELSLQRKEDQLKSLTNSVIGLREEVSEITSRLEDEQLEAFELTQRAESAEGKVAALRRYISESGNADDLSLPAEKPADDTAPGSFDELIERFDEFKYVRWTGDAKHTEELDERDPLGRWARKTWDALCALEDYAREKLAGRSANGIDVYLTQTPSGCRGYSANRHARDESEDVRTNAGYSQQRRRPVPVTVDPSGTVFMGAHFKIAQSGLISPRMHYYDALEIASAIYIGYIGRHLDTKQTN